MLLDVILRGLSQNAASGADGGVKEDARCRVFPIQGVRCGGMLGSRCQTLFSRLRCFWLKRIRKGQYTR